ncbi:MAG: hypothetical protein ACP5JG_00595, partial [Anaerolineae bacterium]
MDDAGAGSRQIRLVLLHSAPAPGIHSQSEIERALHHEMIAGIPTAPDLADTGVGNAKPMVRIEPQGLVAQ